MWMCAVLLPPAVNPIAVKYIYIYIYIYAISCHIIKIMCVNKPKAGYFRILHELSRVQSETNIMAAQRRGV
jgi:hypothetical protein